MPSSPGLPGHKVAALPTVGPRSSGNRSGPDKPNAIVPEGAQDHAGEVTGSVAAAIGPSSRRFTATTDATPMKTDQAIYALLSTGAEAFRVLTGGRQPCRMGRAKRNPSLCGGSIHQLLADGPLDPTLMSPGATSAPRQRWRVPSETRCFPTG
jgi:hypothetical protein